jgi:hypothetical protein
MARKTEQRRPEPKSKTDLRRGQSAPGIPGTNKGVTQRATGTTRAEEAMLFAEQEPVRRSDG